MFFVDYFQLKKNTKVSEKFESKHKEESWD